MNMIRNSSAREHRNAMISSDASEILAKSREQFVGNQILASLRAEHQMKENVRIFVRHPANMHIVDTRVCDR